MPITQTSQADSGKKVKLYVGNIAPNVNSEDVSQLFGLSATPFLKEHCCVELATDEKTGKSKGFAFVTVPEHVSPELQNLNNIEFYGRQLVIEESANKGDEVKTKQVRSNRKGDKNQGGGYRKNNRFNFQYKSLTFPPLEEQHIHHLFDGGVHLVNMKFQKVREKIIAKAVQAGVSKFIVTGLTLAGSKNAVIMAEGRKDTCYAAVSLHPHWLTDDKGKSNWSDEVCKEIRELASKPCVVAIGETGIDLNRNYSDIEMVRKVFKLQIQIAIDNNKALIVHEREAFDMVTECLQVVNVAQVPVVLHCYTGSVENMEKYLQRGYYIGITGFICKEKYGAHLREAIKTGKLPLERIIIQSNAPYMIPNLPVQEQSAVDKVLLDACFPKQNEPHTLLVVVRTVAKCAGKPEAEVAHILNNNSRHVYKI